MKVSVIIPVYNGSAYLAAALQSVLAQTYALYEIIIVDDGSTDPSPEILRSFGDRLRVIRQRNQGVAVARNVGLAHASGDLITFLDQDDLWPADRTRVLIKALETTPEAQVAVGLVEILYERTRPQSPLDIAGVAHREFYLGSLCIKTQLFSTLGQFHTGIGYADDVDFMMRRREANINTVYVDEIALRYRFHDGNTSYDRGVTNSHLMSALRESLKRRRKTGDKPHDARS